jgi:hypothetical protein
VSCLYELLGHRQTRMGHDCAVRQEVGKDCTTRTQNRSGERSIRESLESSRRVRPLVEPPAENILVQAGQRSSWVITDQTGLGIVGKVLLGSAQLNLHNLADLKKAIYRKIHSACLTENVERGYL